MIDLLSEDMIEPSVRTHKLCNRCVTCRSARLFALPYAGHPDYREEWRP